MSKPKPIEERLLARSVRVGGCLIWMGHRIRTVYGVFKVANRSRRVHRVAYEVWVGPIPDGLEIDHLCRNRACIEPSHLEAVTHRENIARSVPARVTHCPSGHEYTEENTLVTTNDRGYRRRRCRTCRVAASRAYRESRRSA